MPRASARKLQRASCIVFVCVGVIGVYSYTRTRSTQVIDLSADNISANFDNLHKIINGNNFLNYHNLIVNIIVGLCHN